MASWALKTDVCRAHFVFCRCFFAARHRASKHTPKALQGQWKQTPIQLPACCRERSMPPGRLVGPSHGEALLSTIKPVENDCSFLSCEPISAQPPRRHRAPPGRSSSLASTKHASNVHVSPRQRTKNRTERNSTPVLDNPIPGFRPHPRARNAPQPASYGSADTERPCAASASVVLGRCVARGSSLARRRIHLTYTISCIILCTIDRSEVIPKLATSRTKLLQIGTKLFRAPSLSYVHRCTHDNSPC